MQNSVPPADEHAGYIYGIPAGHSSHSATAIRTDKYTWYTAVRSAHPIYPVTENGPFLYINLTNIHTHATMAHHRYPATVAVAVLLTVVHVVVVSAYVVPEGKSLVDVHYSEFIRQFRSFC